MALGIYFAHEGFTPEKYSSAIKQLEAAGIFLTTPPRASPAGGIDGRTRIGERPREAGS